MAKVKVLDAVVNGVTSGNTLEVSAEDAKRLEAIGYVEVLEEKKAPARKASPKKDEDK
ncbi:hypothetical protein LAU42_08875 [Macrococcus armenti]|uniref:hypothetical protein n=1 Tax=Macrococcus armenti TaxID=2875764 RepID=UPI001CCD2DB0|nr:hypothetical protein [Macrococcus armenti]UBH21879.1 hypothetical protein LAU42_08875 [Macrococcus armenti]